MTHRIHHVIAKPSGVSASARFQNHEFGGVEACGRAASISGFRQGDRGARAWGAQADGIPDSRPEAAENASSITLLAGAPPS